MANWAISACAERLNSISQFHSSPEASYEFLTRGVELLRGAVKAAEVAGGLDTDEGRVAVRDFMRRAIEESRHGEAESNEGNPAGS